MGAEMIDWGWRTALALGLVIVVVLALRAPVRRGFGAGAAPSNSVESPVVTLLSKPTTSTTIASVTAVGS